jgi:glycerophosphoryl diester phosphodiesterase
MPKDPGSKVPSPVWAAPSTPTASIESLNDTLSLPESWWIVGHRGAAGEELENTLSSILVAVEQRADMIEMDVQMTADSELVLFHDRDLERLAQDPTVVEDSTVSHLASIPLHRPHHGPTTARIALLEEALSALPPEIPINLELKRRRADRSRFARALRERIVHRERVLVSSFDWQLLREVRKILPGVARAPIGRDDPNGLLEAAREFDAFSLHCHRELAPTLVEDTQRQGRPLLAYTVNDPREARHLLGLGVRGLFTDHPAQLRRELAAGLMNN